MCKSHNPRVIDKCMRVFIEHLNIFKYKEFRILACCCGHGKYPMTIVVRNPNFLGKQNTFDLVSGQYIPRLKKFYKKDKQGYYYIPEVVNKK